jgi:hypothetical protein
MFERDPGGRISYGQAGELLDGLVRGGLRATWAQDLIECPAKLRYLAQLVPWLAELKVDGFEPDSVYAIPRQGLLVLDKGEHDLIGSGHWAIRGEAHVKKIEAPAVIHEISGNAVVEEISDAFVDRISGSSTVYMIFGHSFVRFIEGRAKVEQLVGMSTVYAVFGDATIAHAGGFNSITSVYGNANLEEVGGHVMIGQVSEQARIGVLSYEAVVRTPISEQDAVEIGTVSGKAMVIEHLPFSEGVRIRNSEGTIELHAAC